MRYELELMLRLLAAALFTGLVGWERETARKSAGLRTHVLVGLASALFVVVGLSVSDAFMDVSPNVRIEPLSLIQAVAVGIGFLGSGIVRLKSNSDRPQGLTTAASIWAAAGLGLACGFGKYVIAGGTTLLLLIVLRGIQHLERRYIDGGDKSGGTS
ncbi:MAG TPA: MgtC/SapB family protein [Gemmatimonadaceae bacterium]|jgi:putative Mg2+ transporter-C (MgtC) family protein|nr:MgtC/SapB family protein [Gemmatimonadaceae bacterium]